VTGSQTELQNDTPGHLEQEFEFEVVTINKREVVRRLYDAVGKFMSMTESLAGRHPPGDELAGLHNSAP
jgi:hypothetical protein